MWSRSRCPGFSGARYGSRVLSGTRTTGQKSAARRLPPAGGAPLRRPTYRTTTAGPAGGASRSFRDVDAAGRGEPVPFVPHQLDDLIDLALGHAVGGVPAGARRHRPWLE